ncbi:MAG: DUF3105 domain-containing protein [Deltaproteobacteria bacterium]|nr:DUF3105 domain-containing protein [Deltaproteobacteria bacterium]
MILALALACTAHDPSAETGILGLCEDCAEACVEEFQVPTAAAHVTGDVIYEDPPPSSGDHDGCWSRWGVHVDPVPDERWVHNLEHGGVVFLYDCPEGCAEEVATHHRPHGRPRRVRPAHPLRWAALAVRGGRVGLALRDGVLRPGGLRGVLPAARRSGAGVDCRRSGRELSLRAARRGT